MRYYLDTNTLVFLLVNRKEISRDVSAILHDYNSIFYVSSIVIKEIIHLHKRGIVKKKDFKTSRDLLTAIKKAGIEIKLLNENHLQKYAEMNVPVEQHNDPNDHAIIAQAIADKIPVISSDGKFKLYENQGLQLVFNKR